MIGMRMVEADDVFAALAAFALNAHQFPRINVVAVVGGVCAGIPAARGRSHDASAVVFYVTEQDAAAFVGIGLFAVTAEGFVVLAGKLQHEGGLTLRSRISHSSICRRSRTR